MDLADVEPLFVILSDPAAWLHDPPSRHADLDATRRYIERAAAKWRKDRLSYWTARRRDTGEVVGHGGAQRHRTGSWNLSYRTVRAHQGHGYATELAWAARSAALSVDADVPLIARIDEHNAPSRRVAEHVGLRNYGLRLDEGDGQLRLAYADRALDDDLMARRSVGSLAGVGDRHLRLESRFASKT